MKNRLIAIILSLLTVFSVCMICAYADIQEFASILPAHSGEGTIVIGKKTESKSYQNGALSLSASPSGREVQVHVYNATRGNDATGGGWVDVIVGGNTTIPYTRSVNTNEVLELHGRCTNGGFYRTTVRGSMDFR